jgi:hypothetical protein
MAKSTQVRLHALWGNGDAESTLVVTQKVWDAINAGERVKRRASAAYEGKRFWVYWFFEERELLISDHEGDMFIGGISELHVTIEPPAG